MYVHGNHIATQIIVIWKFLSVTFNYWGDLTL